MRAVASILSIGSLVLVASPALAKDRLPTPQERTAIEKVLRAQGFVSWEEIEYDDDRPVRQPVWDVDDARTKAGTAFDLKLEPGPLTVLRRSPACRAFRACATRPKRPLAFLRARPPRW